MADLKNNDQGQKRDQNVPVQQTRQQGQGNQAMQRQSEGYRSPFQLMRDMLRDPWGLMSPIESQLAVAFEVRETPDAFVFEADVPGIKKDDIEIQVHGNRLQVSGKRDVETEDRGNDRYYTYERSYGSFMRVFTLPDNADFDHIQSNLDAGVLKLHVPKKPGQQPRKIEIGGAKNKA